MVGGSAYAKGLEGDHQLGGRSLLDRVKGSRLGGGHGSGGRFGDGLGRSQLREQ
jgi:hypothetical protein